MNEIWSHVHRLPPHEREVVELIYGSGHKATEVAKRLNTTPNAVYGIQARAMNRLRTELTFTPLSSYFRAP